MQQVELNNGVVKWLGTREIDVLAGPVGVLDLRQTGSVKKFTLPENFEKGGPGLVDRTSSIGTVCHPRRPASRCPAE